jgi:hypothetical protein
MSINRLWHEQNRMPKNATIEMRIKWHIKHRKKCSCRDIPAGILKEIKKRQIKL